MSNAFDTSVRGVYAAAPPLFTQVPREGEFSEVELRHYGVLRRSNSPGPTPMRPTQGPPFVLQGVGGLGAHRTQRVRELVQERGAELLLLPSYSPDLNPIEEACNKAVNSGVGYVDGAISFGKRNGDGTFAGCLTRSVAENRRKRIVRTREVAKNRLLWEPNLVPTVSSDGP